ncbi:hypothetical protein L1987_21255 [Smallanthus sonchifolius]|uniref:Uncharacterized protein n=1 Tax=Smallanthus sonchifolius TaxID=185202 RepID=A0ACB9IVR9_9ASTR|nr:hypothetical protein L1987_21255 [Smallanthus sonchifolius]
MKFLHSPSSSSSSTTNYTPTGCIPAVLRRLLCFHTLPTFPLDNHIKESYVNNDFQEFYCGNKLKGNPGIVGKLMGLDSMPDENPINKLRELKLRKKGNYVLEAPAFVEVENEKFIILSFEGGGKDKELQLNSCKLSNLGKNSKKLSENSRKKKVEKGETESDSENSSPVSVLEFSDHQETSYSGKEDLKSENLNSRRKLRGDLDKNAPSPSSSPRTNSCNSVDNDEEYVGLEKKSFVIGESKEMWEEICQMVERDVMDSSRWKGYEDFEEIGVCFELQILDQLILELLTIT